MASLSTQDFTTLVRNMVTSVQAASKQLINLNIGSVLRAILEGVAGVILWLQGLAVYILTLTRAATSVGPDLDSWMADYDFPRLPATDATGQVTFSRFTNTTQALVSFETVIQTGDGTQSFTVDTDSANAAYNAALGGFVIASGTSTLTVSVTAVTPGTGGNVLAGSITSMSQGISGVDTVTNASDFTNGVDAELDPAFRKRFVDYLASLSKATLGAVESAIENVQQGIDYTITANQAYSDGSYSPGFFYAVIDDGTGYPSSTLLDTVRSAINSVDALTIQFAVFAPAVVVATPTVVIDTDDSFNHTTVVGLVGVALRDFINSLPIGESLPYTKVASIAYGVAGVINVTGVLLNGGTSDVDANQKQKINSGTPIVS